MINKLINEKEVGYYLLIGGIFVLFLSLRIFALGNTVLFEDYDSLGYLEVMKIILQGDLEGVVDLNPSRTPGYGIFGAFFSLPGWGVEFGARLTSLFFSSLVFLVLVGIGKHIARPWETSIGLLLISISPPLISHSVAVLSEPTYIALIYLGLWVFWGQCKNPVVGKAAVLGVIFGFAFLTRTEGFLYLLVMPFLQGVSTYWFRRNTWSLKHLISWSLVFILCFGAIAAPQIWRVSEKMGSWAINGRQVWMAVLNNPDARYYHEKIKGLDYSPAEVNISYLYTHPEEVPPRTHLSLIAHLKNFIVNFNELNQEKLGILLGPMCLIAFGIGLLSLFQSGFRFEASLILAFIALNLLAPLLHNVVIRHILVIAPLMCLVAGIGIVHASEVLVGRFEKYSTAQYVLPVLFLLAIVTAWVVPLFKAFNPADSNKEYSLIELREPLRILKDIAGNELGRVPIIVAERGYLTYFLGGTRLPLPYASYQSLVRYFELNKAEFLYFTHKRLRDRNWPFFKEFTNGHALADFTLVYAGADTSGEKVELYRFRNDKT